MQKEVLLRCVAVLFLAAIMAHSARAQGASPIRFAVASTNVVRDVPHSVSAGDFNADGNPDFVTANQNNSISVSLGAGNGTFGSPTDYPITPVDNPFFAGLRRVATDDLNRDGRSDVVLAYGYESGRLAVYTATNGGNLVRHPDLIESRYCDSIAFADFNGDGHRDLVVSGATGNYVTIHFGEGDGRLLSRTNLGIGTLPDCVTASDVNRDGRPDVLVGSETNYIAALVILLNQPSGAFVTETNLTLLDDDDPIARSIAVADFNRDGSPDVAVGFEDQALMTIILQRDGQFGVFTNYTILGQAFYCVTADFDGNGFADLATPLDLLLGTGTGEFTVRPREEFGWMGKSITVADVNRDGRPDTLWTADVSALCSTNNTTPALRIQRAGTQVELSWPAWNSFSLESAANLTPDIEWRLVKSGPMPVNGRYRWLPPVDSPTKYFRLRSN